MKLTPNTIKIILEDFIDRLAANKVTVQDFDNIFELAAMTNSQIPPETKKFLEDLRADMHKQEEV